MMKKGWLLIILLFIVVLNAPAQKNKDHFAYPSASGGQPRSFPSSEIGIFGGASYYTGDLNPEMHFHPAFTHFAFGLFYRRNLSNRWALRFTGLYGRISGDDAEAKSLLQQRRNLHFKSPLIEGSAQFEFSFFTYSVVDDKQYATPYVFGGLAAFWFNPQAEMDGEWHELQPLETEGQNYSLFQPAFLFGLGAKFKISHRFLIGMEWGLRKTFTDYLDDVSTNYPDRSALNGTASKFTDRSLKNTGPGGLNTHMQRGNSGANDWYSFAGITLSLRIGQRPGQCNTFGVN